MPIKLGTVGHFGITVRDVKKAEQWWVEKLNLKKYFSFPNGSVVGNDDMTIVLIAGTPHPEVIDHVSFHLPDMKALRSALEELKRKKVDIEDPGDEIGPEAPGSRNMGLWFHDPDGYRWELSVLAKPERSVTKTKTKTKSTKAKTKSSRSKSKAKTKKR